MWNKSTNSRRSASDRFIPRRSNANFDLSYYYIKRSGEDSLDDISDSEWFSNSAKQSYNLDQYRSELWKAMMPKENKILVFSSPKKKKCNKEDRHLRQLWPVYPRSKPLLNPPSAILDMPDMDTHIAHQIVDWGKKGYIGTIYENEVHLWHPEDSLKRLVSKTNRRVQFSLKFNADGSQFAVALDRADIAVWDCQTSKIESVATCLCPRKECLVTAMEYSRNNCLITGCSKGRLCSWSPALTCTMMVPGAHADDIITIKLSCNENYLVTSGLDCIVSLWKWPSLGGLFKISFNERPIKALAWHPWKDSILVISSSSQSILWNVSTLNSLEFSKHPYSDCLVDCLTFNPLSGELVGSYYVFRNDGSSAHLLKVFKDFKNVVDEVRFHDGRVPYLLWDSTGTKLATASADENLCIWDFFGTSTDTEKKYLRLSKKRELSTDMLKNLNIFNSCIR